MPKVIVVGSTGQVGRAVVADFAAAGWDVTAVHRGRQSVPPSWGELGVSDVVADRSEPGRLEAVLATGADTVVDVVAFDAADGRQLLAAQEDVGSLVVVSTLDVYVDDAGRGLEDGRDGVENFPRYAVPIREENPTWAPDCETYGSDKVALEQALRDGARVRPARDCAGIPGVQLGRPRCPERDGHRPGAPRRAGVGCRDRAPGGP